MGFPWRHQTAVVVSTVPAAASLDLYSGDNTVTLTAINTGVGGNDITITVDGVAAVSDPAKALVYAEVGNDMTVQLATSDAVAATVVEADKEVTARVAGAAGNGIAPVFVGVGDPLEAAQALALTDTAGAPSVQLATTGEIRASKVIQDITFTAPDTEKGTAGNDCSIEFLGAENGYDAGKSLEVTDSTPPEIVVQLETTDAVAAIKTFEQDGWSVKFTCVGIKKGTAGNALTISIDADALGGYTESGTDITIQLVAETTAAEMVTYVNQNASWVVAEEVYGGSEPITDASGSPTGGVDSAIASTTAEVAAAVQASGSMGATGGDGTTATAFTPHVHLENGAASSVSSTTAEATSCLDGSSQVSAIGGSASIAEPLNFTPLSGGTDSAITSTTAQFQGIFSTSTLVTATGGSTGTATAVSKTNLSGGA